MQVVDLPLAQPAQGRVEELRLLAQRDELQVWAGRVPVGGSARRAARELARGTPEVVVLALEGAGRPAWIAACLGGRVVSGPLDPARPEEVAELQRALRPTDRRGRARAINRVLTEVARLAQRLARAARQARKGRALESDDQLVERLFPRGEHEGCDALLAELARYPLEPTKNRKGKVQPARAPTGEARHAYERLRAEIVRRNVRLVFRLANRMARRTRHLTWADHFGNGVLGLFRAVDKYDLANGARFSTYAHHWVSSLMERAVEGKERLVRLPHHVLADRRQRKKLPPEHRRGWISLSTEEADVLTAPIAIRRHRETQDAAEEVDLPDLAGKLLVGLPERTRRVLELRLFHGLKLEEVARVFDVTRERVRQIERKGLTSLLDDRRSLLRLIAETRGWELPETPATCAQVMRRKA